MNLTEVKQLGELWNSKTLTSFVDDLSPNISNPNAGARIGLKVFWTNDYVVSRGEKYVTTLKMFSARTKNTECTNVSPSHNFGLQQTSCYLEPKCTLLEVYVDHWY